MRVAEVVTTKNRRYKIIYIVLAVALVCIVVKLLSTSLFFTHTDRINIVIYAEEPKFYSLSTDDTVNYIVPFYPDLRMPVPGGYGSYRIGGLGKLVALEHKPELFKKTFTSATSTYVDFYFYPKNDAVYYGKSDNTNKLPMVRDLMLDPSNANIFDRLYFTFFFLRSKESDFTQIDEFSVIKNKDSLLFQPESFAKTYQGYFYNKSYRNEKQTVQLIYTKSYSTALLLSRILDGNGIRVVDLSQEVRGVKKCEVIEDEVAFSQSSRSIASFFGCNLQKGKLGVSDILLVVGPELEAEWSAQ